MDRFFNDDDEKPFFKSEYDDDDDDDDDLDDFEAETIAYIQSPDLVHVMHVGLNQNPLLDKAVEIASQHWLWRFKSAGTKLTEIAMIYSSLQIITSTDLDIEDPQEPPQEL